MRAYLGGEEVGFADGWLYLLLLGIPFQPRHRHVTPYQDTAQQLLIPTISEQSKVEHRSADLAA